MKIFSNQNDLLSLLMNTMLNENIEFGIWGCEQIESYDYVVLNNDLPNRVNIKKTTHQNSELISIPQDIITFISDSKDIGYDLICIAHEFGHSKSSNEEVVAYYNEARSDGAIENFKKEAILTEEHFAWNYAEYWLKTNGFDNWILFKQVKDQKLLTYENILTK
jgi:hypothetical protein